MSSNPEKGVVFSIDQDPARLSELYVHLKREGYSIMVSQAGASALKLIEDTPPDIVLLDICLPDINGLQVCQRLKANETIKDIPVIFLTAETDINCKIKGLELGASDYIVKPSHPREILARLHAHLETYRLRKRLKDEEARFAQEGARRRWVLEALQESRERYRFLAESATDIIAKQDFQGIYRYVSPACMLVLGYKIEEMVGHSALEFAHPDDLNLVQESFQRKDTGPLFSRISYRARHKNGGYIWLETTIKVIRNAKTRMADEIITVSRDITDRKAAQAALQKARDELEERVKERTAELAKLNLAYGRFVPHEFLYFLNKESIIDVQLGDQVQQEMTILFSDIRSFTELSEQMSPQENFNFLNSYLSRVSPIIRKNNGFVDKYIGDALMALFPEKSEDALQAAINVQQEVVSYNQHRDKLGYEPIKIGIGLHTGTLMLGTIGEAERMESTVVSDAVNLASRMEGLTKLYGASIVISEESLFRLDQPNRYHFRFLDRVQVKGKSVAIAVFEIFNGDQFEIIDLKLKTRTDFEKGLLAYHSQEFPEAEAYFRRVLDLNPGDKAAQLYLKRVAHFLHYGVPVDWEGVVILNEK